VEQATSMSLWSSTVEFVNDVRAELKKVSFPSMQETMGSTMVVIIFCVIMSIYLSLVDSFLVWLISKIV
jgi:preprotein translocase subunit SecE